MRIRVLAALAACLLVCAGCALTGRAQHTSQPTPSTMATEPSAPTEPSVSSTPESPAPPTMSPASTASLTPAPPASSSPSTRTSPSGRSSSSFDPAREFDGATTADPEQFPGLVTPVGFSSPSGNIQCGFTGNAVVCQLNHYTYRPEPAHDCHGAGDWGTTIRLEGSKAAGFTCAGDVESGGPALPYGSQLVDGVMRCVSRSDGVTCENTTSGKGFWVARQAYVFFPSDSSGTAVVPQALVGAWSGHGRALTIKSSGAAVLAYRTYRMCSDDPTPPCDKVENSKIIVGGKVHVAFTASSGSSQARGTVTSSSDPQHPKGQSVMATLNNHQVQLKLGGSLFANFCDAQASAHGVCGA